jgi:hypothetical protein
MSALTQLVSALTRWPVESQQRARRNAMIASTALARRRAELDDVEEFLASLGHEPGPDAAGHNALG